MELIKDLLLKVADRNSLIVAFAVVGVTVWMSYLISNKLTRGRIHGSAIAIVIGLVAAYWGGVVTGGKTGVADIPFFSRYRYHGWRHAERLYHSGYCFRRPFG